MNSRLAELANAFRSLANACTPVKQAWKVKYLKKVPFQGQVGMFTSQWTVDIVAAYTPQEAAQKVNPKLRPEYNCIVTKVRPGEVDRYEGQEVIE